MLFNYRRRVIVEVSASELTLIRDSLFSFRNHLIRLGKHTDPVDELLSKLF